MDGMPRSAKEPYFAAAGVVAKVLESFPFRGESGQGGGAAWQDVVRMLRRRRPGADARVDLHVTAVVIIIVVIVEMLVIMTIIIVIVLLLAKNANIGRASDAGGGAIPEAESYYYYQ